MSRLCSSSMSHPVSIDLSSLFAMMWSILVCTSCPFMFACLVNLSSLLNLLYRSFHGVVGCCNMLVSSVCLRVYCLMGLVDHLSDCFSLVFMSPMMVTGVPFLSHFSRRGAKYLLQNFSFAAFPAAGRATGLGGTWCWGSFSLDL